MSEPEWASEWDETARIAMLAAIEPEPETTAEPQPELNGHAPTAEPTERPNGIHFADANEFAAINEPSAAPIIGDEGRTILTAGSTAICFAEAGEGKTTLEVDMVAHAAAGVEWLGLPIPHKLRIAVIENEGARGPFRRKIAAKLASWEGPSWARNVFLLEEPWGNFDLTKSDHREQLALFIIDHEVDLLVAGPLVELGGGGGMANGGTPAEVTTWTRSTIEPLRILIGRPLAIWLVHHTNKAGDISGAWRRYPATLLQIFSESEGQSAIKWDKVRDGSLLHHTTTRVQWDRDTAGYTMINPVGAPPGPRKASAPIIAKWIREQGGQATPKQLRDQFEISDGTLRDRRQELTELGIDYVGEGNAKTYIEHKDELPLDPAVAPRSTPQQQITGEFTTGQDGSPMREYDPVGPNPAANPNYGVQTADSSQTSTPQQTHSLKGVEPPPAGPGSTLSYEQLRALHADELGDNT